MPRTRIASHRIAPPPPHTITNATLPWLPSKTHPAACLNTWMWRCITLRAHRAREGWERSSCVHAVILQNPSRVS